MIQLLFSILRTISHNFQFNSSSLSKFFCETAHNASSSTDVDTLKFQLDQYDTFYGDLIKRYSLECLMMLIDAINKGSVPYCGSYDVNSTGISLSEILFNLY